MADAPVPIQTPAAMPTAMAVEARAFFQRDINGRSCSVSLQTKLITPLTTRIIPRYLLVPRPGFPQGLTARLHPFRISNKNEATVRQPPPLINLQDPD